MMLVALTLERFMAVCHPEKSRILNGSKRAHFIIASIPICTLFVYGPHLFRSKLVQCISSHGKQLNLPLAGQFRLINSQVTYTAATSVVAFRTFLISVLVFRNFHLSEESKQGSTSVHIFPNLCVGASPRIPVGTHYITGVPESSNYRCLPSHLCEPAENDGYEKRHETEP